MDAEQIERRKQTMHKTVEYMKRHHDDFIKSIETRQKLLCAMQQAFDEYTKKVVSKQGTDCASK